MEKCHWFETEEAPKISEFMEDLQEVETFFDICGHTTIRLMKCKTCGQLYLKTFIEIYWWGSDVDDLHSFIVPVSENDIEELRKDKNKCYDYYDNRKYFTWYSGKDPFWGTGSIRGILIHSAFK